MYIKKIILENIRCFEKLEIGLDKYGSSALILGDNGDGKSTLLKSLAIGLCDESSAAGLHRELPGEFVRKRSKKSGKITIELENKKTKYRIETTIDSLPAFERIKQKVFLNDTEYTEEKFPWSNIFVCGYGPGRQTQGIADIEEYTAIDAVYTLFRYYEPLQNPDLAALKLIEKARDIDSNYLEEKQNNAEQMRIRIINLLKKVLNLDQKDEVIITYKGIEIKSHWGRHKLSSLADGYQATVTWIMDFLTWRLVYNKSLNPDKMSGIVIIDEIEQHLHPRWQINIMRLLQEAFPKIQFIATTHSPLVASGCECEVYALKHGKQEATENLYGWLAEDVYRYMGLPSSRSKIFKEEIIDRYRTLYRKKISKKLSSDEKKEINNLRHRLDALPASDPIALSTELNSLAEELRKNKGK